MIRQQAVHPGVIAAKELLDNNEVVMLMSGMLETKLLIQAGKSVQSDTEMSARLPGSKVSAPGGAPVTPDVQVNNSLTDVGTSTTQSSTAIAVNFDDGTTWSPPLALSGVGQSVQGAWPAVAPDGKVYAAWVRWSSYPNGTIDIEMARSNDGGASFTPVTSPMTGKVNPRDAAAQTNCGRPALKANSGDGIRIAPVP